MSDHPPLTFRDWCDQFAAQLAETARGLQQAASDLREIKRTCHAADLCKAGLWDIDPTTTCPICGALPDTDCKAPPPPVAAGIVRRIG